MGPGTAPGLSGLVVGIRLRTSSGEITEVADVVVDVSGDGLAPGIVAEGGGEFVLREADGLEKSLRKERESAGGAGFDVAASDGGAETREDGAEIAGGDVMAGEERVEVVAEACGGAVAVVLFKVIVAEVGAAASARSAAAAAIGEGEAAERDAVLRM